MKFIFKTTPNMKPYNSKKFYISNDFIDDEMIEAGTPAQALKIFCDKIYGKYYISVSKNALKNKQKMYIDTKNGPKQIGYIITGKTDFESNGKWVDQYIELWIEVLTVSDTIF